MNRNHRNANRGVWPYVCAAALIALASPLDVSAQAGGREVGWTSAQAYGPDRGNPELGKRVAQTTCVACHGADGNSANPQFPKLAGQNPAYLYEQLWAFKTGARPSIVMSRIASTLSDADAANVASFYARQRVRPDPVEDVPLAREGGRVFFARTGWGAPPCAMCHGSAAQGGAPMMGGMGMMGGGMMGGGAASVAPNIQDQHAAYIVDQLNRFASGQRPGTVMGRIAAALTPADRNAVAVYLSGLR